MSMDQTADASQPASADGLTLTMRRTIEASAERLYEAWVDPEQLLDWWGPRGVHCIGAQVDLRLGGRYRIGNRMPDGTVVWITGTFEAIEPGRLLSYSWAVEGRQARERVTVRFEPQGSATEVVIIHERIADPAIRDDHERGWEGCLSGLARWVEPTSDSPVD
jgi:uncharacterized protein YndB with AHSA1/START domain